MTDSVFVALAPMLLVIAGGLMLMLAEVFGKRRTDGTGPSTDLALGTFVTLTAGGITALALSMLGPDKLPGAQLAAPYIIVDRFSLFFAFLLCLGSAMASLLAGGYLPEHRLDRGEFYPLLTFSTVGAMVLASAGDLLSLFVGLETMSLAVYAMIGLRRGSARALEGAVKYFLLGSFATALLLYGGALVYGVTGHTDLAGIGTAIRAGSAAGVSMGMLVVAMVLILSGLAFKVSAVPFHMWTPDAYEGAPTPTTSYMAVAVKSAAFAMMLRVLLLAFGDEASMSWGAGWPPVVALLAVLTMTVANLIAGRQESVKRMLAYSSIAHAGYVLVAVVAMLQEGNDAQGSVLFYLLAYTVSTAGAFGALILCGSRGKEAVSYADLAGLGRRHPAIGLAFSFFLLSLAGIPPTAGFFAKLYVIRAGLGAGLYVLVVLLVLNSVVAAYYYLKVMVYLYMRSPEPGAPVAQPMRSGYVAAALVVCAAAVLLIGLWPTASLQFAIDAALAAR
ncbi:MAG: NADH-quinone oxidoreductase subunit N [Deltaproteobacteria bacterium]|jgi:NADH-quinone oxidoreductase subunit N|nr:NADH-quinone oxidoreductase subunit N [Deltaproteobacteria bacterium]MBW2533290.1 NADH-quinone oxidoreductase subunit N [Deltaproteobacteria bacterium]